MNRPAFVTSLACALIAAAVIWSAAVPPARGAEEQTLEIATKNGVRVFSVELAVTDEERQRGLMFRRSLPESRGMLFDFKRDQDVQMWMHNTYISLDMIFIEADGRIRKVAENTEPDVRSHHLLGRPGARGARGHRGYRQEVRHPGRRSRGVAHPAAVTGGLRAMR